MTATATAVRPYYEDEACTIYHGDCRDIWPSLEPADMVLTDPPYGIDRLYGRSQLGHRTIEGDTTTDLMMWLVDQCPQMLADDRWVAIFSHYEHVGELQDRLVAQGFGIKTVGVWDKGAPALGAGIRNQYEMFVLARKGKPPERFEGGNVWRCVQPPGRPEHPHEKPIEIMRRLVEHYSEPAGLVLDPCMGGGTTLRAAKDCNRRAIGIEIEERYCELAAKRLGQEVLNLGWGAP